MNINCFSKEKKMEKKTKKIFVPKMKGGLWKDGGEVLKSGRMSKVRKMLDKDGNAVLDEKGRVRHEFFGEEQKVAIIKHKGKDDTWLTSFCYILGPIFENGPDDGTDWSGPVTMPLLPMPEGTEMKIAGWYKGNPTDVDYGKQLNGTISQVIDPDKSEESTAPSSDKFDDEDIPF